MKRIHIMLVAAMCAASLFGCSEADRVNTNISQEANNFNITRRLAVINARTDKPLFEMVGNFALSNNGSNELVITAEISPGKYQKHYVYLNEYTMYVVEDLSGSAVSRYHYEVNFLPEMFQVFEFVFKD